jgi:ribosomal protein L40E
MDDFIFLIIGILIAIVLIIWLIGYILSIPGRIVEHGDRLEKERKDIEEQHLRKMSLVKQEFIQTDRLNKKLTMRVCQECGCANPSSNEKCQKCGNEFPS